MRIRYVFIILLADCYEVKAAAIPDHHAGIDENPERVTEIRLCTRQLMNYHTRKTLLKMAQYQNCVSGGFLIPKTPVGKNIICFIARRKGSGPPMKSAF
jgi:hypothetical protein